MTSAHAIAADYRIRKDHWDAGAATGVVFIPENGGGAGVRLRKGPPE